MQRGTTSDTYKSRFHLKRKRQATHQVFYGGNWYRTQAEADAHRKYTNDRKRARHNGWGNSEEEVEDFLKVEAEHKAKLEIKRQVELEAQIERDRFREDHDLAHCAPVSYTIRKVPKSATIGHLNSANNRVMSAEQRVALIKSLYDDKTITLKDVLIKTCQIVGAEFETLKGRN